MAVVKHLPDFYKPLALLAFYTGMRQGEVRSLTRDQLDLPGRMIRLTPQDTKEGDENRVPLHRDIIPILKGVLGSQVVGIDRVFLGGGGACRTDPSEKILGISKGSSWRAGLGLPRSSTHVEG